MKNWTFNYWSLSLAVVSLTLLGGCARETVSAAPAIVTSQAYAEPSQVVSDENAPPPEAAEQQLENAPAKVVTTPTDVAPAATLSPSAAEVARMSQSGVDENVMLAYVNNANSAFSVGSDDIIYLNDIGVPGNVVTAMIQRDQVLRANAPLGTPQTPDYSNQTPQYQQPAQQQPEQPLTVAQDAPPPPEGNVSYTYFRDSLAPYGNWIEVQGYGQCWQPSVVVVNREWTPYCDRGRWVYSDCGWYWSSDYSWGWAPFHYGRWFRHNRFGWCWAPDTVWGPSWVSWRYNQGYCGWAPLPPTACYRPGVGFTYYGRSVSASFGFGLTVNHFTFVAANHFTDPRPFQHRLPRPQVTQVFNNTVIINPVVDRANPRFHRGIPAKEITTVTHTEIKQVKIQETTTVTVHGRPERHDANRGVLTVFRPTLPTPPANVPIKRIGEGIRPATPATAIPRLDPVATMHRGIPRTSTSPEAVRSTSPERRNNETVPIFKAPNTRTPNFNAPAANTPAVNPPGVTRPNANTPAVQNPTRNPRETENTTIAPRIRDGEDRPASRNLREAAPVTPRTAPSTQINPVPRPSQPATQPPRTIAPIVRTPVVPQTPVQPQIRDGQLRDSMQRSQPRQEKDFSGPTAPIRSAPQIPTYQAPRPAPVIPPTIPDRAFTPAAPAPRAVTPQVPSPRIETPRAEPRAVAPPASRGSNPNSNADGNPRDKRNR